MVSDLEKQRRISNALMEMADDYVCAAEKAVEIEKRSPDFDSTDYTCDSCHSDPGWNYWVGRMGAYHNALIAIASITSASEDGQREVVRYFIDAAYRNHNA